MKKILLFLLLIMCFLTGCAGTDGEGLPEDEGDFLGSLEKTGSMELKYAKEFSVTYYGDELALIDIFDTGRYLVAEEGAAIPGGLPKDLVIIQKPLEHTYVAASSVMDLYRQLGVLCNVEMTSTKYDDWSIPEVRDALDSEDMFYVGKYGTPDFEFLLDCGCDLAIESTMIYHKPETKEKLETVGIPVLVEHSSYEENPLGRLEWIKLYGLLNDRSKEAESFFEAEIKKLDKILTGKKSGKKTAFFYITPSGAVNIRSDNDYIAEMIRMAGGRYVPENTGSDDAFSQKSTMSIQMESFYSEAYDADVLIYNSTVYGGVADLDALFAQSALLKDFKAVKEGNVWCSGGDMYQKTTAICDIIRELNAVIEGSTDEADMEYMYRLK